VARMPPGASPGIGATNHNQLPPQTHRAHNENDRWRAQTGGSHDEQHTPREPEPESPRHQGYSFRGTLNDAGRPPMMARGRAGYSSSSSSPSANSRNTKLCSCQAGAGFCEKPSRRWRSATSACGKRPMPAGMGATVTYPEAAAPRTKNPARTTRLLTRKTGARDSRAAHQSGHA
jgi:hypothetical protein